MIKAKENALDLEYNSLLGQLAKIKDMTEGLHQDVSNLSLRLKSLSKRNEISEEFKSAAEKANARILEKLEGSLRVIRQK
mgnify:CR=1 FL=1